MNLEIRAVFGEELEALADMRVRFVQDLRPEVKADVEGIRAAIRQYLTDHLAQKRYVGYLGREGEALVCSAGLLLYDLPPLRTDGLRRIGHVLNFYTRPEYRRRGAGRRLMDFMIEDARRRGLCRLVLNATKMGAPLYRGAGFHLQDEEYLIKELA